MQLGDVLLVRGDGKISSSLVAAQKAIYGKSQSSHVELSLGDGTFVHATNDGGVHIAFIKDELEHCKGGWRVIRLKSIDSASQESIAKAGLYFLRQGYNKKYMGSGTEHSSFCSELVAKAYKKAGIEILSGKLPSKIAPAHFDEQADLGEDWIDVTQEYQELLSKIEQDELPYRFAFQTTQGAMEKRAITNKGREAIFAGLEMMAERDGKPRLKELVEESKKFLREKRELDFWDANDS